MKKSIFCIVVGAVAGIALTLATAAVIPVPEEDRDDLDDFFTLDGCK